MSKTILVLICLLHALAAYDLSSIVKVMVDIPLGDKTYPSKDGKSYIKLTKVDKVRPTNNPWGFHLGID
jgi:hypothetical protein